MTSREYMPSSAKMTFRRLAEDIDHLVMAAPYEVATANHMYDVLLAASIEDLLELTEVAYAFLQALPPALAYRLLTMHQALGVLSDEARPQGDEYQQFWRTLARRREADYWDARLTDS